MPSSLLVRPCIPADLPQVTAIYAWNVVHGTGTFELEPPDAAEMARRRDDVLAKNLPWLVAEQAGRVLGYAYATHFRPRKAFWFCVENSVYLAPEAVGQGAGKRLMVALLAQCEARGARQMVAVIGDSANQASIGLHRSLGFEHTGILKDGGWKHGAWRDVVFMQRALGAGNSSPPDFSIP